MTVLFPREPPKVQSPAQYKLKTFMQSRYASLLGVESQFRKNIVLGSGRRSGSHAVPTQY